MNTFSLHSADTAALSTIATLKSEVQGAATHAFAGAPGIHALDPETAARRYLNSALASPAIPSFTAPKANQVGSEFKSIGAETVPLTDTVTVKFRQNLNKIPVYGSLVTVELDGQNELIGIDSALGTPQGVDPLAKLAPADAAAIVQNHSGYQKELAGIVPRLNYYFDQNQEKWRLVFMFEDVPVVPTTKVAGQKAPVLMDYFVDAHDGDVVAEFPRTPAAGASVSAVDDFGVQRQFRVEANDGVKTLFDAELNVQTYDFEFRDPVLASEQLPGDAIQAGASDFSGSAVSAHANACEVSRYMREVLKRSNIDNQNGRMTSSINCVDGSDSPDGKQWLNAFWNGSQMVYGQRIDGAADMLSMSAALDVVAHEMFHGVTDKTSRLVYAQQSGALNESYSDIFGIIINNQQEPDARLWNWALGGGLLPGGDPFRDLSNPGKFGQPEHMTNYKKLPNTRAGDYEGVHTNSGIHNKAAYNMLTGTGGDAKPVLKPREVAAVFYLALTQHLAPTSQFRDSRNGVLSSARSLFRKDPPAERELKLKVIGDAFSQVGVG
ncbi:M4 family metallopeptidase [Massilia sp. DJPM01]|uniref:M4 family metallopeptidase n=1 Tax=Massilia sp. DJPM01 TaxID=3024404 RepID=UPI00259F1C3A|nr:M4 family metallopeptidase [Massilia sp. DJPM01]MDM5177113.1 M4 family metallopeptidase [Massilia sp. DJPM01]